jgi:RimJ/RimL family protein N-acetyltransferase
VFSHHIQAALAAERRNALLAEAEAHRRARTGRAAPRRRGHRTKLHDGSEVVIRPVRSRDAPLLADGFTRLSVRSRQLRFLTPKKELSPRELRYLTGIDHDDHEALGAVAQADGRGVGVARYVRAADDPQAADIAVIVVDEWQGRGLGTALMAQLSERARGEGIRRFTALVAADNVAVAGMLRRSGAEFVRYELATVRYEIPLIPGDERKWREGF